jgi:uncharacterized glyoxalase superfamily protein PhnB
MKSIAPNIFVADMKKTIEFYELLGFKTTMTVPEGGDFVWVMMNCGEVNMMFQTYASLENNLLDIHRTDGGSLLLYIQVSEIKKFFESIKTKVTVLAGLEKTFYGATEFSIKDNNGYVLTFAEHENQ